MLVQHWRLARRSGDDDSSQPVREMRAHVVLERLAVHLSGRAEWRGDRGKDSSKRQRHCWIKSRPPPASAGVPCGGEGGEPACASSGTSDIWIEDDMRLNIRSLSSKSAGLLAAAIADWKEICFVVTRSASAWSNDCIPYCSLLDSM